MLSIFALTCSLALANAAAVQHHDSSIVEIPEDLTLDQFCMQWSGACSSSVTLTLCKVPELSLCDSAVAAGQADSLCQAGFGTPVYPCTISGSLCSSEKASGLKVRYSQILPKSPAMVLATRV